MRSGSCSAASMSTRICCPSNEHKPIPLNSNSSWSRNARCTVSSGRRTYTRFAYAVFRYACRYARFQSDNLASNATSDAVASRAKTSTNPARWLHSVVTCKSPNTERPDWRIPTNLSTREASVEKPVLIGLFFFTEVMTLKLNFREVN